MKLAVLLALLAFHANAIQNFTTSKINKEQDLETINAIQTVILESLQKMSLNMVQVFVRISNGIVDDDWDPQETIDFFSMNCTYQIAENPVNDEPGYIVTLLYVNDLAALKFLTSPLHIATYPISRYFIILLSGCGSRVDSMKIIKEMFEELWSMQIADVILMCRKSEAIELYTFYPYSKDHCNEVKPVLVTYGDDYFPRKNLDLHGCSLKVAAYKEAPHFINNTAVGIDAEMVKFLSKALNFQLDAEFLTLSEANEAHYPDSDFFKKVHL